MTQIAFIWGSWSVYWSGIVIALAVLSALLAALAFRLLQGRAVSGLLLLMPFALLFSLLFSRLLHFYCFYRQYASLWQALTDFSIGSFLLPGAFAGVLLAVLLARLAGLVEDVGELLDAMSPATALGLAVGRLSFLFNAQDRGKMVFHAEWLRGLPFSTAISSGGGVEWRGAVFFWQSLTAALLFLLLSILFFIRLHDEKRRDGGLFLLFMMLLSASEILFDSMRYDSAFLRSNGFVSLVQILGITVLVLELTAFAVRAARRGCRVLGIARCCVLFLLGTGITGFMEYLVQRHADAYPLCYGGMIFGLLLCCAALLQLREMKSRRHI